jgi:hypothetical protein
MLKISPAVTVKNVPSDLGLMDYILFPDSVDKDAYYALAEFPTYRARNKKPDFNLTWYFGDNQISGGICTFTVALPMPNTDDPKALDAISNALAKDETTIKIAQTTFALCQAMDAGKTADIATLKAELGFDDKLANDRKSRFDKNRDYKQFLPQVLPSKIMPIPFKTGTVTVQAFANDKAYQEGTPAVNTGKLQTTPSLVNSNAAVVTFNLKDVGANLFWHGLGGPSFDQGAKKLPKDFNAQTGGVSVISVTYTVEFDGLLPEAKATVTLDSSVIAKLDVDTVYGRDSWGRRWSAEVQRGKSYDQRAQSATKIELPAVASEKDGEEVRKLLTDWAAKQLEDMAKIALPEIKLDALNMDNLRQLSTKSAQSREYTLTQAVTLPKNPQAQLQKISALAGSTPLETFFELIDLNDKPYFPVRVTVNPPNLPYLKARSISRFAVTDLSYVKKQLSGDSGPVTMMEYKTSSDTDPASVTLKGDFDAKIPEDQRALSYNYVVAYADGTPSLQVKARELKDSYLDLAGVDIGVVSADLDGVDLPWDVIDSATVVVKYGAWEKKVTLTKDSPDVFVAKPFGKPITDHLKYKLTVNPTSGDPVEGKWTEVTPLYGHADITLPNPLGDTKNSISFRLAGGVSTATLRVEYTFKSADADRVFEQIIDLDASTAKTFTWRVPALSNHASPFRVISANVDDNDLTDLSGGKTDATKREQRITVSKTKLSMI